MPEIFFSFFSRKFSFWLYAKIQFEFPVLESTPFITFPSSSFKVRVLGCFIWNIASVLTHHFLQFIPSFDYYFAYILEFFWKYFSGWSFSKKLCCVVSISFSTLRICITFFRLSTSLCIQKCFIFHFIQHLTFLYFENWLIYLRKKFNPLYLSQN